MTVALLVCCFWPKICCFRSKLCNFGEIPHKIWFDKTPPIKHIKIFGSKAYVLIKDNSNGKFDSKSEECVLVGYSNETKAYRLWNPRKRNITISRNVKVLDKMYFKNK